MAECARVAAAAEARSLGRNENASMIERIVGAVAALAPFLAPYPVWVKGLFAVWVVLAAALAVALVLARPTEVAPPTSAPVITTSEEVDSLRRLRDQAVALGGFEHAADDQTVPITAYPTLVEVQLHPEFRPLSGRISIARGESVDMQFKDRVLAVGFYYRQGLYPSNFNIYFDDGTQSVIAGRGYFPNTEFLGMVGRVPITRVIVQTQAQGNLELTGLYVFAHQRHSRVFSR